MSDFSIPLEQFQIQTPCTEDWAGMHGDDAKRFCDKCNKHVHDLSHFDRAEADALLARQTAGHVCVRMGRDAAGMVITRDYWKFAAGAALAASVGLSACNSSIQGSPQALSPAQADGGPAPAPMVQGGLCPPPAPQPAPHPEVMGKVAAPAPVVQPAPPAEPKIMGEICPPPNPAPPPPAQLQGEPVPMPKVMGAVALPPPKPLPPPAVELQGDIALPPPKTPAP